MTLGGPHFLDGRAAGVGYQQPADASVPGQIEQAGAGLLAIPVVGAGQLRAVVCNRQHGLASFEFR